MPSSIFNKLGIGEFNSTHTILQMADKSVKYPRGHMEDVFVNFRKFTFHIDFIVLDIKEDQEFLFILRWPFLATRNVLIDIKK